jgi:hypothetical protein
MVMPRSNQSRSPGRAGGGVGGHPDLQRVPGLAVVGHLAGDFDPHVVPAGDQRQHLRGERHGVETAEGMFRLSPGGSLPGHPRQVGGQPQAAEHRRLRLQVAERVGRRAERRPQLGAADLVGPLPADIDAVAARVGGPHHERGLGDLRCRERAVRGRHRGRPPQPRIVPGQERRLPGLGDHEPLVGHGELLELRGHRVGEPGEPEPGELGRAGDAAAWRPFGVDHAVALGADEPQRYRVRGVGRLDHRREQQRGPVAGHVDAELRRARRWQCALLAPVDQREPGRVGLLEDRPELARLAGRQVQVLLVTAVPAVGVAAAVVGRVLGGAGPVEGEELVQQPDVRGGELVAQQHVVKPGPGQVARHPAAEAPRLHEPGLELVLAGGILARQLVAAVVRAVDGGADGLMGVLDERQLDGERRDRDGFFGRSLDGTVRNAEQRVERLLPGQRGPAGRAAIRHGRGQQRLVGRGEHQGGHVHAVGPQGAAAVALLEPQREPVGRAEGRRYRPDLPAAVADGAGEHLP